MKMNQAKNCIGPITKKINNLNEKMHPFCISYYETAFCTPDTHYKRHHDILIWIDNVLQKNHKNKPLTISLSKIHPMVNVISN